MIMATKQLTQVYLDPGQKTALQERAKSKGTKVAEEIRYAVDAYLAGVTSEELELLDAASRHAEQEIKAMQELLEATNRRLDSIFDEMAQLRKNAA
jgi:hypothetical protein